MARGSSRAGRPGPTGRAAPRRSCVVCRVSADKRTLHRLVRSPDGVIRYDPSGKAPGRGAYLCGNPVCTAQAAKRRSVQRALKAAGAPGVDAALNALRDAAGAANPAGGTIEEGSGRQRPRSSEQEEVRTG
jgi:predicted RNA-binding protein YlxR (DUF448 family)